MTATKGRGDTATKGRGDTATKGRRPIGTEPLGPGGPGPLESLREFATAMWSRLRVSLPRPSLSRFAVTKPSVPKLSIRTLSVPRVSVPRVSVPKLSVPKPRVPKLRRRHQDAIDLRDHSGGGATLEGPSGTDVHPRIARRRQQVDRESRRGPHWLRWSSLAVAVVCTLVVAGLFSPFVDLDHLDVQGLEGPPADAVREASGLVRGTAMFGVRPSEVRRRVEELPWVAHADVDAHWPDTVAVEVTPHRPVAVTEVHDGGEPSVLTATGSLLAPEELGPLGPFAAEVPRVVVDPAYGGSPSGDGAAAQASLLAAAVLTQLRPITAQAVAEIRIGPTGSVTLVAQVAGGDANAELVLGGPEDLPAKALALDSVLSGAVELACLERVDVSVPTRVTILRSAGCTIPPGP